MSRRPFLTVASLVLALSLLASPVLAACVLGRIAELAVTMTGFKPTISAKINGAPALFVVDSGAFYSLISPANATRYGLRLNPAPFGLTLTGIGGDVALSATTVKTFTLADTPLANIEFLVGGGEPGAGAAGLIGQNVLRLADVEYDLANGAIRLIQPHACGRDALAYWAGDKPFSAMDLFGAGRPSYLTEGSATVDGIPIRVVFDTGASTSVLSLRAAARAGVKPGDPGVTPAGVTYGLGRRMIETWIAPVASFKIGGEEIRDTRLRIGALDLGEGIDMLLGVDFFLSHRVYVANSQHKLYFTYNGGPVFNLATTARLQEGTDQAPKAAPAREEGRGEPTDAEGFSRRGAAFAARRRFDLAIADFTRAHEIAPTEARYLTQRAMAYAGDGRPALAMADLDQALKIAPDDVDARLARAELRLQGPDKSKASADLDAAAGLAPRQADVRLRIAALYDAAELLDREVGQLNLWIAAHPADGRMAVALNERCWARALMGRDLDKALADCNTALKLAPKSSEILDSRGLVRLRLGDYDKAIADYDAALILAPKTDWSLYGRGLARTRKGLKTQGDADMAAAVALNPRLPEEAKRYGIAP